MLIRNQQLAALRRPAIAEGLVRCCAAAGWAAAFDEAAGEVLIGTGPAGHPAVVPAVRVAFDDRGYARTVTSPEGRAWRIDVDPDGKPLRLTGPDGSWVALRYANGGGGPTGTGGPPAVGGGQPTAGRLSALARGPAVLRQFDWTAGGLLAQVTHADGTTARYAAGQVPGLAIFGDRRGGVRSLTRDDRGRVVLSQDGNGNRTRFEYDALDRRTACIRPDGSWERYEYDDLGLLRRVADAAGLFVSLDYDGSRRVAAAQYGDGTTVRYDRDAAGRPVAARVDKGATDNGPADPGGSSVAWTYDDWGRLVAEDGGGGAVRYGYDPAGRVESIAWPADGGADGGTAHFRYDRDGRLTAVIDWAGGEHHFAHAPDDAGLTVWHPNGLVTTVANADGGRPRYAETRCRSMAADDPPLFAAEYQFDADGRLRVLRDSAFDARSYAYDAEGQLTAVQWAAGAAETFEYDPAGNRTKAGDAAVRADVCNRLMAHGPVRATHDARGNLLALAGPGVNWKYKFDGRGLLVRATNRADGVRVEFAYDAVGRRTLKRAHGTTTRFTWAGDHLVREVVETVVGGRTVRDFLYHPGTHVPLAVRVDGRVYCCHCDPAGAPRRLTDDGGAVAWSADYSAFGRARVAVAAVDQPLRLPGQYCDPETRLHYARTRYYAPDLGRYVSPRPPGPDGEPEAEHTAYQYPGNDPVNRGDPLGLGATPPSLGGTAAGPPAAASACRAASGPPVVSPASLMTAPVATAAPPSPAAMIAMAAWLLLNEALSEELFRPPGMPADPQMMVQVEALANLPPAAWPWPAPGWRALAEAGGAGGGS